MSGYIYLMKPVGMDGPIKIGSSHLPAARLKSLMDWSPVPLELLATFPGTIALEMNVHDCLAASHSHKEWFFATDKVRAFVAAMIAGEPIEAALDLTAREGSIRGNHRCAPAQTASAKLLKSWSMRCHHAQERTRRETGLYFHASSAVDAELSQLRAAKGAVPAGFDPIALTAFVADPAQHGFTACGRQLAGRPAPTRRAA